MLNDLKINYTNIEKRLNTFLYSTVVILKVNDHNLTIAAYSKHLLLKTP